MNPWLEIPLKDYEAHMSMGSVAQAQFLTQVLGKRVRALSPASVAILGCAGGNGFEQLQPRQVRRVVGVDINPDFIAAARNRHAGEFITLELLCRDFLTLGDDLEPVDFVYAGLVFEYVDHREGLSAITRFLKPDGHLSVVLQLPNDSMNAVTPTPYTTLNKLEGLLNFVPPRDLEFAAHAFGLRVRESNAITLPTGKSFHEFLFRKVGIPSSQVRQSP
jgi:SAM-dependent methyltransferase